jgi:lysyl-tRNA synthetase class 2
MGIPAEWAEVILKTGILTIEALKGLNPNKFHQDICGYNKKNKLGLVNPSKEEVQKWIEL